MNFPQNLKYKQYAISKAETEFYSTSISLAQHEQDQNASQNEKKRQTLIKWVFSTLNLYIHWGLCPYPIQEWIQWLLELLISLHFQQNLRVEYNEISAHILFIYENSLAFMVLNTTTWINIFENSQGCVLGNMKLYNVTYWDYS